MRLGRPSRGFLGPSRRGQPEGVLPSEGRSQVLSGFGNGAFPGMPRPRPRPRRQAVSVPVCSGSVLGERRGASDPRPPVCPAAAGSTAPPPPASGAGTAGAHGTARGEARDPTLRLAGAALGAWRDQPSPTGIAWEPARNAPTRCSGGGARPWVSASPPLQGLLRPAKVGAPLRPWATGGPVLNRFCRGSC